METDVRPACEETQEGSCIPTCEQSVTLAEFVLQKKAEPCEGRAGMPLAAAALPITRRGVDPFTNTSFGRGRLAAGVAVFVSLLGSACGTSSTVSSTGPTPVKCVVSLGAPPMMDASGGIGSLSITTQPECAWDVSTNVSWVSALAPSSGQGTSDVSFRVAANEGSSVRDGMIEVNGQQARVSQRAACRYEVGPASQTIAATGGAGSLTITTANECAWTAVAEVAWISLSSSATGTGPGQVSFTVGPNQGEARSGSIAIASQRPSVTQAAVSVPAPPPSPPPACNATISPTSQNISAAGGAGTPVTVSAGSTCQWSATTNVSWITVTAGATGTSNGSVAFSVAANSGAARTGTLTIAGRAFTVTQAASSEPPPSPSPAPPSPPPPSPPPATCSYSISPTNASAPTGGNTGTVTVSTTTGCAWSAASNAAWISVSSGGSGTGSGSVAYVVSANASDSRSGTMTIAGQTFTVSQAASSPPPPSPTPPPPSPPAACSYAISPTSLRVGRGANSATISVSTGSTCSWTASSNTSWITVTSGASGTGNGTVTFSYTRNEARGDRTGSLTVAGTTVSVEQNGPGSNNDD